MKMNIFKEFQESDAAPFEKLMLIVISVNAVALCACVALMLSMA